LRSEIDVNKKIREDDRYRNERGSVRGDRMGYDKVDRVG
jgi:hypothetical protein